MDKIPSELREVLEKLTLRQRRFFAADCAEHVLPYFERFQPLDKRPRIAIERARRFALGEISQNELDKARSDVEGSPWEAGNVAWEAMTKWGYPDYEEDAAASAAATAEACSSANLDNAVVAAVDTAIEVVVIAAVGDSAADAVWQGDENTLDTTVLQHFREAEARERAWQLEQAKRYALSNSDMPL